MQTQSISMRFDRRFSTKIGIFIAIADKVGKAFFQGLLKNPQAIQIALKDTLSNLTPLS